MNSYNFLKKRTGASLYSIAEVRAGNETRAFFFEKECARFVPFPLTS